MSTSPVTPTPSAGSSTGTNGLPSGQTLNNMFLQLLVAQLQNQDPTDPVDPSQFVGQLAQFSELSEVTSIYTLLQGFVPPSSGSGSSGSTPPASGGSNSTGASQAIPASLNRLSPAATMSPNFTAPTLSALTSKIQGAY